MRAAFVVAQSYKTRTGSGLKGTGTGVDSDDVQQKSQEFIEDLKVRYPVRPTVGTPAGPSAISATPAC